MKYRTKRDLPFAKAGAEVRVNFLNVVYVTDRQFVEHNTTVQYLCEASWLNNLIEQGWIEEIKPREWWEYDEPNHDKRAMFTRFYTLEDAYEYFGRRDVKLIKVREVLT